MPSKEIWGKCADSTRTPGAEQLTSCFFNFDSQPEKIRRCHKDHLLPPFLLLQHFAPGKIQQTGSLFTGLPERLARND